MASAATSHVRRKPRDAGAAAAVAVGAARDPRGTDACPRCAEGAARCSCSTPTTATIGLTLACLREATRDRAGWRRSSPERRRRSPVRARKSVRCSSGSVRRVLGFALEAGKSFGIVRKVLGEELQCNVALQASIATAIHDAHAPFTQTGNDFVGSDSRARCDRHGARDYMAGPFHRLLVEIVTRAEARASSRDGEPSCAHRHPASISRKRE
jgi:hypothetical protein